MVEHPHTLAGRRGRDIDVVDIFDTHGLRLDPHPDQPSDSRSVGHGAAALHRALRDGALHVRYRPIWDLVDRQIIGFDALPEVRAAVGGRLGSGEVWAIAQRAGLASDLLLSLGATVEAAELLWGRFGLTPPVSVAPVAVRSSRRSIGRRSTRMLGRPTVSLDLDPDAGFELYGLRPVRSWRIHVPAEEAMTEIRRIADAGVEPSPVRLSASLVHRFTRSATQLALVARCIEAARRHDLVVHADGADDGESVRGLRVLGCDRAAGAGLSADLLTEEIPSLRWMSPAVRSASNRPLRVVAS